MGLEITEIHIDIVPTKSTGKLLALARIVVNGGLVINQISILSGKFGPFISFYRVYDKSQKTGFNICFPSSLKLHDKFSSQILAEYSLMSKYGPLVKT